jgi:hypothetical protein
MSLNDDEFVARFEDATLPNESFHHTDHVRMAFLYLRRYPALEAVKRFSASLARFAGAKGKPGLFNETVTWAFLFLIRERMARSGGNHTWEEFAAENADLLSWENNVLRRYYREATLKSDLARSTFVMPDKIDVSSGNW